MNQLTACGTTLSQPASARAALRDFLQNRRVSILTGAGISTDSGIPDYRGPQTRHIKRNPVTHDQFVNSEALRRRYWARASRGYAAVRDARPNANHRALTQLQQQERITGLITQNVDGLHQAAGTTEVIELHGSLHRVSCLACGHRLGRTAVQQQIEQRNPGWLSGGVSFAPDGDAEINEQLYRRFRIPECPHCAAALLMPDVVFFGGRVPKERVQNAREVISASEGLLVVGSSLTVYSGFRFAKQAHRAGLPVAILGLGPTRADALASLKLDVSLLDVLPPVAANL